MMSWGKVGIKWNIYIETSCFYVIRLHESICFHVFSPFNVHFPPKSCNCHCGVIVACTSHLGGENLNTGKRIALDMRDIPRNNQATFTCAWSGVWMLNLYGSP